MSFAVIAQHSYQATSRKRAFAREALKNILWDNFHKQKNNEGHIASRGLRVEYDDCNVSTLTYRRQIQTVVNRILCDRYSEIIILEENTNMDLLPIFLHK